MTPADLQHLRHICERAACNATVTLMPVRVLKDLMAAYEMVEGLNAKIAELQAAAKAEDIDGLAGRGA